MSSVVALSRCLFEGAHAPLMIAIKSHQIHHCNLSIGLPFWMLRRLYKHSVNVIVQRTHLLECISTFDRHTAFEGNTTISSLRRSSSVPDRDSPDTPSNEDTLKRLEGAQLLRSLNAYSFTEYLRTLGQERLHMTVTELMQLARDRGAAASTRDSRALCDALVAAGVVFRYRDVIYLSTDEVAETLLTSLPNSEAEFEKRAKELEAELTPLEKQKASIESNASTYSGVVLWGGFWFLVFQFAVFFRFTFWEYSWDVMEPMAYFVSLFYGIVVYSYFLLANENFEYDHLRDRLRSFFRKRMSSTSRFDQAKYEQLTRDLAKYRRYLTRYRI